MGCYIIHYFWINTLPIYTPLGRNRKLHILIGNSYVCQIMFNAWCLNTWNVRLLPSPVQQSDKGASKKYTMLESIYPNLLNVCHYLISYPLLKNASKDAVKWVDKSKQSQHKEKKLHSSMEHVHAHIHSFCHGSGYG